MSDTVIAGHAGDAALLRPASRAYEGHFSLPFTFIWLAIRSFRHGSEEWRNLWEENFKSVVVEDGLACKAMVAYIDLNPVRAGMVQDPAEFRWSSYGEAMGATGRSGAKAKAGLVRAIMAAITDLVGHDATDCDLAIPGPVKTVLPHLKKLVAVMGAETDGSFPAIVEEAAKDAGDLRVLSTLYGYVGPVSDHAAFSGSQSSGSTDGGTSSRVFGSFLSWMQEKTKAVFVVATANDVSIIMREAYGWITVHFLRASQRFGNPLILIFHRYLYRVHVDDIC